MAEISNRTILALLAVTLVVTVAGTIFSVGKLGGMSATYTHISGAATGTGEVDIEVVATAGISMLSDTITLPGLTYNRSCTTGYGWLDTRDGSYDCLVKADGSAPSTSEMQGELAFENNGTVDGLLTFWISGTSTSGLSENVTSSAEWFFCGTDNTNAGNPCPVSDVAYINFTLHDDNGGQFDACQANGDDLSPAGAGGSEGEAIELLDVSGNQSGYNVFGNHNPGDEASLCSQFTSQDDSDQVNISFGMGIPSDASAGSRTLTLTFYVTEVA